MVGKVRYEWQNTDERLKYQFQAGKHKEKAEELIRRICNERGINIKELQSGSRRGQISEVRSGIACELVEMYGIPLAEIARQRGVSTSAVSKILKRTAHAT